MYNNYNQGVVTNPVNFNQPNKKISKSIIVGVIGCIIIAIGCFLDFATCLFMYEGTELFSQPINYMITEGNVKDGLFILIMTIIMLIHLLQKKGIRTFILVLIIAGILVMDTINLFSLVEDLQAEYRAMGMNYEIVCQLELAPYTIGIGIIIMICNLFLQYKELTPSNEEYLQRIGVYNNLNQNINYNQQQMYNYQPNTQNQYYNQPQNNQYPNNNQF